jgi:hypothetical protein
VRTGLVHKHGGIGRCRKNLLNPDFLHQELIIASYIKRKSLKKLAACMSAAHSSNKIDWKIT